MKIKNRPFIIGEVAFAHEGSYRTKAIKIGNEAFKAGHNALKFQIFR